MLSVKKTISKITNWISNRGYAHTGYGTAVDISTRNSASNAYTCPTDGMLQLVCNYRAGSYIMGYVDDMLTIEGTAPSAGGSQGNSLLVAPVFKGQKLYVTRSSTYSYARFIPFLGGGTAQ